MSYVTRTALLLVVVGFGLPINADVTDRSDYEQILVPIALAGPTAGAYGSLWETELWARNSLDRPVVFAQGRPECRIVCERPTFPANTTRPVSKAISDEQPGIFLYVERSAARDIHLVSLLFESTRSGAGDATALPVVRESQYLSGTTELFPIRITGDSRTAVRIYTEQVDLTFEVSAFDSDTGELLNTGFVSTSGLGFREDPEFPPLPSYAAIGDIGSWAAATGRTLRITVTPLSDVRYYSFASVTSNETQRVTVISPN